MPLDIPQQQIQQHPYHHLMHSTHYAAHAYSTSSTIPRPASVYAFGSSYDVPSMPDPRYASQLPTPMPHAPTFNGKRLASAHPSEPPVKKKQTKWTPEQDALIIELRGNGMKWDDISRHIKDRSAISCRLRFQNYLERRAEWDDEKKDKLARLYERFKKDMWEKIAKEMACPWRAAEAMHWQLGEVEMARRANVTVFHLAHQSSSMLGEQDERGASVSPPAGVGMSYIHTHSHSLPQNVVPRRSQPLSPEQARMGLGSCSTSPSGSHYQRHRADSAQDRILPPIGALGHMAQQPGRYLNSGVPDTYRR